MSELEDRINSVLGDPEQMAKITKLAQSFMAGGEQRKEDSGISSVLSGLGGDELDSQTIGRISRLLKNGGSEKKQERALLEAMMPFLSERRRNKMNAALRIARIAGIAKLAMGEMGSGENDKSLSG